jgi:hypothetical protein
VVLNATAGTGSTYVWYRNGAAIANATSVSYTATQAGSYTVQRTASGCSAVSSAVSVVVNSAPTVAITAGGPTTFCTGGSVVLNATAGSGSTYVWYRNGAAIANATSASYTATQAGSYTVQRTVSGCSATSSAVSVTLTDIGSTSIQAAGPTTFAAGGSVVLNATAATGSTYIWYRDGVAITGSSTSNSISASVAGNYTVARTLSGCTSTSAGIAITVTGSTALTITAGGSTTFCAGLSVVLNASAISGATYQWRRDNTAISGATAASYTATQSGSYTVQRTSGGSSVISGAVVVTVNPLPVLTMSASPSSATVSVTASGATAPYTYTWNTSPVQTTATATVSASGTYSVSVLSAAGCRRDGSVSITLSTPLNCTGIRAESQGTWGANSNGYDPAAYMNSNFAAGFPGPSFLTIGCGTRLMRLTSSSAVGAFLPSYGSVTVLPAGTLTDPGGSYSNNLAAELVALKLSIRFDELSTSFSPSTALLKNMLIASGPFAGWTVQQLVAQADAEIGGCSSTYGLNSINSALVNINYNYYQGSSGNGFLICPASQAMVIEGMGGDVPEDKFGMLDLHLFPNPTQGPFSIQVHGLKEHEPVEVVLLASDGRMVRQAFTDQFIQEATLELQYELPVASGVYLVQVRQGDLRSVRRLVVE